MTTTIVPGFAQSYRVPKLVFHVPVAVSTGLDGDAFEKLVEVATSILTAWQLKTLATVAEAGPHIVVFNAAKRVAASVCVLLAD
ncbi:hypothetical protein [Methylobacterium aerolatum]|uniref:Uncharacterized protein n=1 Tax=Methylobacterium aerolatum TaxID=418708 RepID=A0ABU0I612_9HYPH|nr:hypothetical protein [Methylobacterium aerolatum]MDQ0450050.1 hypothetical protein [Methylobacterium aerolatum]